MKEMIKRIIFFCFKMCKKPFMKFRKKKLILIYSHFVTMDSHIIKYYESINREDYTIKFVFFNYNKIDKNRHEKYGISKKDTIRNIFAYYISAPNLIVVADLNFQKEFFFPCKKLQLGHGGGPTVYDGVTTKRTYMYGIDSVDKKLMPKYDIYLEANSYVIPLVEKENPNFKDKIWFSSNKYLDEYKEKLGFREQYREQLGISKDTKVVFLIGSWNENSLFHTLGKTIFNELKYLAKNKKYKIMVSIHPREYTKYSDNVEPYGKYVDELEALGIVVKKPGTDMIPYIIASDLVFCDYSSVMEECILCDKKIILSDFDCGKLYEHSNGVRLKQVLPVIKDSSELKDYISMEYTQTYFSELKKIKNEIDAPPGFYSECCVAATKKLLEE